MVAVLTTWAHHHTRRDGPIYAHPRIIAKSQNQTPARLFNLEFPTTILYIYLIHENIYISIPMYLEQATRFRWWWAMQHKTLNGCLRAGIPAKSQNDLLQTHTHTYLHRASMLTRIHVSAYSLAAALWIWMLMLIVVLESRATIICVRVCTTILPVCRIIDPRLYSDIIYKRRERFVCLDMRKAYLASGLEAETI